MARLYLASGSPRRAELLDQIGVRWERLTPPGEDESPLPGEAPEIYVRRLAAAKAGAGWNALPDHLRDEAVVLGADTTVVLDGDILGKPGDAADARQMLLRLSGRNHQVLTAVCLRSRHREDTVLSASTVSFICLDEHLVERYIACREPFDKAGAYGIQGFGAVMVASLSGSYSGVVGLPLAETAALLRRFGVDCWQQAGEARP